MSMFKLLGSGQPKRSGSVVVAKQGLTAHGVGLGGAFEKGRLPLTDGPGLASESTEKYRLIYIW